MSLTYTPIDVNSRTDTLIKKEKEAKAKYLADTPARLQVLAAAAASKVKYEAAIAECKVIVDQFRGLVQTACYQKSDCQEEELKVSLSEINKMLVDHPRLMCNPGAGLQLWMELGVITKDQFTQAAELRKQMPGINSYQGICLRDYE